MGNPQGKDFRLHWLAGFIDGEGCFYVQYCKSKSRTYKPWFKIANTDYGTLDYLVKVLKDNNIAFHIYHTQNKRIGRNKMWYLQMSGHKRLKRMLSLVSPYLVTKKQQCDDMLELVSSREDKIGNYPYTTRERELINCLRDKSKYLQPSTTKR